MHKFFHNYDDKVYFKNIIILITESIFFSKTHGSTETHGPTETDSDLSVLSKIIKHMNS